MTEPEMKDDQFSRYSPQHPLPKEIREMTRDDTVCQYCGVSYLIHSEMKKLEEKLKATEKELEHYKGKADREAALIREKEDLITLKNEADECLQSKENVLQMLKQEIEIANKAKKTLEEQSEKYREQYLTVLRKFSCLSTIARKQKDSIKELRFCIVSFKEAVSLQVTDAKTSIQKAFADIGKETADKESRLQCLEMEQVVTTQANKSLADKLRAAEQHNSDLQQCEAQMNSLDSLNAQLKARLKAEEDKCKELEELKKHNIKEQQERLQEAEKVIVEMTTKNRTLQTEIDQFHKQVRLKSNEVEELTIKLNSQSQESNLLQQKLDKQLRQKEGELAAVHKHLKNLENKHREVERQQKDITQQNMISSNEAKNMKESLERARGDVEALKNERETMITAHQARIEELRESFKRKMAESDRWPEKLQEALGAEKTRHTAELATLEAKLKESFVMELKIEKEKYDELMQKYQTQSKEKHSQRAEEISELEARHQRNLEAVNQQLREAKREAQDREGELRKEIDSLKRIIKDLQDRLGRFESSGEEKVGELNQELSRLRAELQAAHDQVTYLNTNLQQTKEEVQFLQDTVRNECEERFELTEALSEARRELLSLRKGNGAGKRASPALSENGLAPLRQSMSINSINSANSEDKARQGAATNQVNVSYKGDTSRTPRVAKAGSVDDNRKRISALLGRP